MNRQIFQSVPDRDATCPHYCLICMQKALWRIFSETSENGIRINGECYKIIRFANNVILLGRNEEQLQNALHRLNSMLNEKCGVKIDRKKTKVRSLLTWSSVFWNLCNYAVDTWIIRNPKGGGLKLSYEEVLMKVGEGRTLLKTVDKRSGMVFIRCSVQAGHHLIWWTGGRM